MSTNVLCVESLVRKCLIPCACLLAVLALDAAAQTASASLPAPVKQGLYPGAFSHNRSHPAISNGYLISFTRHPAVGRPIVFSLSALQDGKQETVVAPIQAAAFVEDAAVTADGNIALGGSYRRTSDGAASNFLAEVSLNGNTVFSVDLGDYTPERVCVAPDGSVWTLGQQWPQESGRTPGDYAMLRRFNTAGALTDSYVPRNLFARAPALNFHHGANRTAAFLACGTDSVGVYVGAPNTSYWSEVQISGGKETDSTVVTPPHARVTGLVLFGQRAVYASLIHDSAARDLYRLNFDSAPQTAWTLLPSGQGNPGVARLLGRDGANLVYFTAPGPVDQPVLYWSAPKR
ncbi:MAG TPA: hypothetical protein VLW65_16680 [Bryobacteraceae bacterium]|nr:hypothetical protein [Bryobacteraceae bacterium]